MKEKVPRCGYFKSELVGKTMKFRCRLDSSITSTTIRNLACPQGDQFKQKCALDWSRTRDRIRAKSAGPHIPEEEGHIGTDLSSLYEDTRFE